MRSYYAHLQTTAPEAGSLVSRPVYRSSAIFPALYRQNISTRILFLGYWMLKRNVDKIATVVTLRAFQGEVLARQLLTITEAKAYAIELSDLLASVKFFPQTFEGTIEIEFFASSNLYFPYPAVVINYYGPSFSTVVHTAQRTFNDFEDMQKNCQTMVPESGFNIRMSARNEPFIGLINGTGLQENARIDMQFFNVFGEMLGYSKELGDLDPYELKMVYPAREVDLLHFLKGYEGSCKSSFSVKGIFPRLLVGNQSIHPEALSITHSYYDCSSADSTGDYWRAADEEWHMASLMLPLWPSQTHFTDVYFYPIYSPSSLAFDIEIFNASGQLLACEPQVLVVNSPAQGFAKIAFNDILKKNGICSTKNLAARIIARPLADSQLPARIKIGLDIGHLSLGLPCNICMNLQPFNPPLETKPSSFKWFPFLSDQPLASVWLMNSSPRKNFQKKASLEITFYRQKDTATLKRALELPPHGFLSLSLDPELNNFFAQTVGWATVTTDNAFLTTYYFADHLSGVVGGDHGF